MSHTIAQRFTLGDFTITALILGEICDTVADWFESGPLTGAGAPSRLPVICLHVAGPGLSVLIDACDPRQYPVTGTEPVGICTALRGAGCPPEGVTHVILTHGHHDHFCGVWDTDTDQANFPNARHILSARDWGDATLTAAAQHADGPAADPRPLEQLLGLGLLDLDTCTPALPPALTLIDAPGETDGHRVVRLCSQGQTFYFLADLFHLPAEIEMPDLCPVWADAAALNTSRRLLLDAILKSDARFMCSHMSEVFTAEMFSSSRSLVAPRSLK
ncbi:MBL fold metallo-hydrolase [Rhodobacteraceae bacterium M382]|nr:MBL fold metallo-hydrolase [Rhodobacteraceae bacterium M382]